MWSCLHIFHSMWIYFPSICSLRSLAPDEYFKTVGACARSHKIPLHSVAPCDRSCRIECTISGFCQHKSLLIFPLMWPDFPRLANLFQDHNPNSDREIFHFFTFRQLIIFIDDQSLVSRTLTWPQRDRSVQFLSVSLPAPRLHR